jgi:hypothetical protein
LLLIVIASSGIKVASSLSMLRVDVLHNRQPAITVNETSLFSQILRIIKTVKEE